MLWSLLLALASATPINTPKVLNLDITRHDLAFEDYTDLDKRDAVINDFGSIRTQPCYTVELEFGTPKRSCKMWLDTGSYSAWVRQELYDYRSSSTAEKGDSYSVGYIGGGVTGHWVKDKAALPTGWEFDYKFGQIDLKSGYFSNFDGLMGIAPYVFEKDPENQGIIDALYRANHISTRTFGLWLGSHGNGSIAFGGIDTSKFKGELTVVPFGSPATFQLPIRKWYGFDIHGNRILLAEGCHKCAIDTGAGVATLPTQFVDAFKRAFNVTQASNVPEALEQGYKSSTWVLKYQGHAGYSIDVAGFVMDIPMEHWLEDEHGTNLKGEAEIGRYYGLNLQTGGCLLGSHHFFHNYYVVPNYERWEFAIAPAVQDTESMGASHLQTLDSDYFAGLKSAPAWNDTTTRAITAYTTYFPGDARATAS